MALDIQKVLEELPALLRTNPNLRYEIFRVLSENFTTREETAQLLRELREMREETAKQFRELRKENARQMREAREENARQIRELREETAKQFREMREENARQMREVREENARQMREVHVRFEALQREMDERFAKVDERFAKVDERFEALHREMHEGFRDLRDEMRDVRKSVDLQVGHFQTRAGKNLEDLVAATLRLALSDRTIREDSIRLRQKFVDQEGLVRPKGREVECDLLVRDGRLFVFEIKSYAKEDDVANLADKVTLVKTYHPDQEVVGVLVTMSQHPKVAKACEQYGIVLAR